MEKIDFVLPWVDGNDPQWRKSKSIYSSKGLSDITVDAEARFRDMGTLRYVLRSIEQHCPWYNKIYLITAGHYPDWLDIDHERIVLITHEELYFDKSHLPVFSSSSIEMNLANIPELSEKFIYLNDDMIIMKKTDISRFFYQDKPVDFLSHGWISRNKLFGKLRGMNTWIQSINNNLALINQQFNPLLLNRESLYNRSYDLKIRMSNFLLERIYKRFIWLEHWHHPQPYLRKTLNEVSHVFKRDMMQCSSNRFRDNDDLTQYLYRYWHLAQNDFYPTKHNDGLVANITSSEVMVSILEKISQDTHIRFVCFNDDTYLLDDEYDVAKQELEYFLESMFPKSADFELICKNTND